MRGKLVTFFSILALLSILFVFNSCDKISDFLNDITSANVGDTLWTYQLSAPTIHFASTPFPVGGDGTVYFAAGGNGDNGTDWSPQRIYALDKANGTIKWHTEDLETWHINSYIVVGDNGNIYVASGYHLYSINPANGSFNWTWEVPQSLPDGSGNDVYTYGELGPIALANDGSILTATSGSGSYSRAIYKINSSGITEWHRFIYSTTANTPMSVGVDGTIYKMDLLNNDNYYSLTAIDPTNGLLKWSIKASYKSSGYENIVITSSGDIILFEESDSLEKIDHSTHQIIWKIPASGINSLTMNKNGDLFIYDQYNGTSIINSADGSVLASGLSLPQHPIVDNNNQLYGIISDWHPHLSVTDDQGNIIWESTIDFDGNSLVLSDDNVIYMRSGNVLYALQGDNSIARSGWPRVTHDKRNTFNVNKW